MAGTDRPDVHATAATRLRASGERYTAKRRALVDVLSRAERPVAMPDILAEARDLAQSSAYRNLVVLERAGVAQRVATGSGEGYVRFELAEDLTEHHHHVVCSNCGRVQDFTTSPTLERTLDHLIGDAARQTGFELETHSLDLIGLCETCS
jgi:Fur family ferric uptake transcriptional regulator